MKIGSEEMLLGMIIDDGNLFVKKDNNCNHLSQLIVKAMIAKTIFIQKINQISPFMKNIMTSHSSKTWRTLEAPW